MCGIAGGRRCDGSVMELATLQRMASAVEHRGPDDEGYLLRGDVGLAHRRLSIIDLAGSPQPMSNPRGDVHVCFNGEILNYKQLRAQTPYDYRTGGDTEVLLALFEREGPAGVQRLAGQFAYSVLDERTGELWLFRDRTGILPLFYAFDGTTFLFASEIKSLLAAMPRRPDVEVESLAAYLRHRYVPAPATLFSGIRKLLPGHWMRITAAGPEEPVPYWEVPTAVPAHTSAGDAVAGLDGVLRRAVDRNLVADVPVGAYLSGGVDSSLIVALAAQSRGGAGLETFSAGFGEGSVDERPHARAVAEHFGTTHHEVVVGTDDYERLWAPLTWHRDAPVSEASDIAVNRLAALAREHVKVVLSGEGADELFGGYPKHKHAAATRLAGAVPKQVRAAVLDQVQRRLPPEQWRLRTAVRALTGDTESARYSDWFSSFTAAEASAMVVGRPSPTGSALPDLRRHGDALRRMLVTDTTGWLPDNLLERADRMSMAVSLETRPPFLDTEVLDYAFSLPSDVKVRSGTTKWVVKSLARDLLPPGIVDRQKVGFRAPLGSWFRGGLRDMARSRLLDPASFVGQVLERPAVEDLLRRHESGTSDEGGRIWTLLALEVWHDVFFVSGAPALR